mmetsp:Transcript_170941/g.415393  ORF Transcript_170941/g.415393 Transcript_170941/m.415393 type:complete len:619 (+) Transcript_170941:62-1918(+)
MAADPSLLALGLEDGLPGEPSKPLESAEFPLDERASEFVLGPEESHLEVLSAFNEQHGLVKTVKNDFWVLLIRQLQGAPLRTSLSLLPPGGRGMRLFGKPPGSSAGLIWDRRQLDLNDAYVWPSGFFAKSDFNVAADGSLMNGRDEALVTLEELLHANRTLSCNIVGRGLVTGEVLPYNEILGRVHGSTGLVGIFARSTRVVHLLWAMGIRALLCRTLPGVGMLPIFVHDPERGMRPFGREAQMALISEHFTRPGLKPRSSMQESGLACLPVDAQFLDLGEIEQLVFHGAFGITEEALVTLVSTLLCEDGSKEDCHPSQSEAPAGKPSPFQTRAFLAIGLRAAVEADNAASALALVRHVAPFLITGEAACGEGPLTLAVTSRRSNCKMVEVSSEGEDFVTCLHRLAEKAGSASVLVPVGAAIALEEFATGQIKPRIKAACNKLEAWLTDSKSVLFRLRSWRELHAQHVPSETPDIKSFVTHKAITNRTQFYNALLELKEYEESHDVLQGMGKLSSLVGELHHPCMRLEILQDILGLDDRYDLQTVSRVVSLALQVVSDAIRFGGPAPAKQQTLSPHTQHFAPDFQLDCAANRMQGLDREDKMELEFRSGDDKGATSAK